MDDCYLFGRCPDSCPCDHYRRSDSETAGRAWLRKNRCPKCRKRKQPACPYKIRQTIGGGWKCSGYTCDDEMEPKWKTES